MRRFEYRCVRANTAFNVAFVVAGYHINGICSEVSSTGIRAAFAAKLDVGSQGVLTLSYPSQVLIVSARVMHLNGNMAGLEFMFAGDSEREASKHFMNVVTGEK